MGFLYIGEILDITFTCNFRPNREQQETPWERCFGNSSIPQFYQESTQNVDIHSHAHLGLVSPCNIYNG